METKIGKIERVAFGFGGDVMFGLSVTLSGPSWGVGDFKGTWSYSHITPDANYKWTEEDRARIYLETVRFVENLLKDAKVLSVEQLKGKPVEATFDGMLLKSWRILTEVL